MMAFGISLQACGRETMFPIVHSHRAFASDVIRDFDFSSKGVAARIQNSTNTRDKKRQHSIVCPLILPPVLAPFRILLIMNHPGRRNHYLNSVCVPATSPVNQQNRTKQSECKGVPTPQSSRQDMLPWFHTQDLGYCLGFTKHLHVQY